MQRLEKQDSLEFITSIGKNLPLRPVDSIYWGQRVLSASFELTDKCKIAHIANGYFKLNTIRLLESSQLNDSIDLHLYHITGSLNAEINRNNKNEPFTGKFSFNKKLVIFHED
jgi:hypothetical protein